MADGFNIKLSNPVDTPEQILNKLNSLTYALDPKVIAADFLTKKDFNDYASKTNRLFETKEDRVNYNISSQGRKTLGDQRYHGGGISAVVHDGTLTGNGTPQSPLSILESGLGTVTSVNASGGTTGLTFSGGPITTTGTLTLAGTLGVANGGTGTTTSLTQGSVIFAGASGVYSQDNANFFYDNTNDFLGLKTAAPTHTLTLGSTATGIVLYNTSDQTINYERLNMGWGLINANQYAIYTNTAGSATTPRGILLRSSATGVATVDMTIDANASTQVSIIRTSSVAGKTYLGISGSASQSSSTVIFSSITPTIAQSSTAGYTTLLINPTESSTGSGTKSLILTQVGSVDKFSVTNTGIATHTNSTDQASNQILVLKGTRATPTANDNIYQSFNLNNSIGSSIEFGRITSTGLTLTSTSEAGRLTFGVVTAGTLTNNLRLDTTGLAPLTNDQISLGFATVSFSDLFLASGAVINYANGNVTLTHSSGILTLGTGTLKITTPTNNTTSVVTTDGTQDLTNKTLNGNTFTAGTYTLTGTAGKTLNFTNTLTLSGTDSTTMTFPSTTATIARIDATQTFTGTQTFTQVITTANAITASGNAATIPVTSRHNIVTNNSAATLTITLTTASAVNMQPVVVQILDFSAVAQTITWVNTENSTVTAPTISNGSTTLPLTIGFFYNSATSKWRCAASA